MPLTNTGKITKTFGVIRDACIRIYIYIYVIQQNTQYLLINFIHNIQ